MEQLERSQGTDGSKDSSGVASADTVCSLQCFYNMSFSILGRPRCVLKRTKFGWKSGHCR